MYIKRIEEEVFMEKDLSIFVLDNNEVSCDIMRKYFEEANVSEKLQIYTDYENGLEAIKNYKDRIIVFVDISSEKFDYNFLEKIKSYTPNIVVTSVNYSTDMIVKSLRIGAKEFLPKPVIKQDIERVLTFFRENEEGKKDSSSKIITIYSNKGGIGKTTVATNLAVELAKSTGDKVALIDLNLKLGDVSTFLNINPPFDVSYVIKNLIGKNDEALCSAFEKYKDLSLYVLSDPNYIEEAECITPQQIKDLFNVVKKTFHYVIIDMSSSIDANSLQILDDSDLILFTTIVNIPAIRNCQRCMNLFRSRRYPKNKVKILINRYMENDEIKIDDIETTLGEKVYWKIPNNYFSIMESINKGIPVSEVNFGSNISNSFKDLAVKISDDIVEQAINSNRIY